MIQQILYNRYKKERTFIKGCLGKIQATVKQVISVDKYK